MKIQKSKKSWYMGYIFSREIDGNIIPQKVQNLVIRDYCKQNGYQYLLSSVEYAMEDSNLMLNSLFLHFLAPSMVIMQRSLSASDSVLVI